ncbi:MAG: hypothetical protein KC549_14290 [Myxococcales bacterium]|nr:hypothetical protein [Myxococcales bacterium]MCB9548982.1 hypothetical protein [Myxococcales bacterium]
MDTEDFPQEPLDRSIFYALCTPLVRLALRRGIPLRALKHLVGMAYFNEARRRGLAGAETAERMGVSLRTVTQLSRRLKDFLTVETSHALPRRLEYLLWTEPLSLARLRQTIRAEDDEIQSAIGHLVDQQRIRLRPDGRYEPTRRQFPLVEDEDEGARLDGLNHLLEAVADTVGSRFYDGDVVAFARTNAIRVRRQDVGRIASHYAALRDLLQVMDDAAHGQDDLVEMALTMTWAPHAMLPPSSGKEAK